LNVYRSNDIIGQPDSGIHEVQVSSEEEETDGKFMERPAEVLRPAQQLAYAPLSKFVQINKPEVKNAALNNDSAHFRVVENNSIRQKEEKLSVGKSDEQSVPVP
jgi:hypothetical protein